MMAAYALRPLLLYLHLYAQLVARKPALHDPHTPNFCQPPSTDGPSPPHLLAASYVPAGGDVADRIVNEKFGQKLDYLADLRDYFGATKPQKSILVGDLNIAPREDDVWSHKQLLKVVSYTPIEVAALAETQAAGDWVVVTRQDIPEGLLYSWWSYRAKDWNAADKGRRLEHIWASTDIAPLAHSSRILRDAREWQQPTAHVPVCASFNL